MHSRLLNLVQRGLISKSKLLEIVSDTNASIDKISKEIILRHRFKDEHLMKVIQDQFEIGLTFRGACQKLGLWTESMEEIFQKESQIIKANFFRHLEKETGVPEKMLLVAFSKVLDKQNVKIKDSELQELKTELISLLDLLRQEIQLLSPGVPVGKSYMRILRIAQSVTNASAMVGILRLHHILLETETIVLSLNPESILLPIDIETILEQVDDAKKTILTEKIIPENIVSPKPTLTPKTTAIVPSKNEVEAPPMQGEMPALSEEPSYLNDLYFTEIDEATVQDFCETFDDTRHRKMEETLIKLERIVGANTSIKGSFVEEDLKLLYRDLHSIKGSARFSSAKLIEKIIHAAEDVLGITQSFFDKLSSDDHQRIFQSMLNTLDLAWELRNELFSQRTEIGYWDDAQKRERYTTYMGILQELKTDLESRNLTVDLADVESMF